MVSRGQDVLEATKRKQFLLSNHSMAFVLEKCCISCRNSFGLECSDRLYCSVTEKGQTIPVGFDRDGCPSYEKLFFGRVAK